MNLSAPRLFQLDNDGTLDLLWLNPPNPNMQGDEGDPVVVTVLLPDAVEKSLTVWFGDATSKTFPIVEAGLVVLDCSFERSELPASGNTYDVYFEYGSQSSPSVKVTLIDSGDSLSTGYVGYVDGVYPPASKASAVLIDAWIVPRFRLLHRDQVMIKPCAGKPGADVSLNIVWQSIGGDSNEIGKIVYVAAKDRWSIDLFVDGLTLQRSDLLLIQSTSTVAQLLSFTILL